MNKTDEKKQLDFIAEDSIYAIGVSAFSTCYCGELFKNNMTSGSILELGPAEGVMTKILCSNRHLSKDEDTESNNAHKREAMYTAVDGGKAFVENLRCQFPDINVVESLFEDFQPDCKFDNIVLGHVLEHVDSPSDILSKCRNWLNPGGRILSAVPNANSLHRQAAVQMGILSSIYGFSEKDKRHGHKRVFDYDTFVNLFKENKLSIVKSGGFWLKPLSDKQIEESWTEEMIKAFFGLGEKYPEIAGEIYVIATL